RGGRAPSCSAGRGPWRFPTKTSFWAAEQPGGPPDWGGFFGQSSPPAPRRRAGPGGGGPVSRGGAPGFARGGGGGGVGARAPSRPLQRPVRLRRRVVARCAEWLR